MRVHSDPRRVAFCNLFDTPDGDVNLFIVDPGKRTCWHRHEKQTDEFRVIRGAIRFGAHDGGVPRYTTLSDPWASFTVIPGLWHGYECVSKEPAYLLMYLNQKYDPTDEERQSEEEKPWGPFCGYCEHLTSGCQCGSEKTEIDY